MSGKFIHGILEKSTPSHFIEPELTRVRNRPDFTNTEPAAEIGPFPQWHDKKKIVAMDPLGHMAPWLFKDIIEKENGSSRYHRLK